MIALIGSQLDDLLYLSHYAAELGEEKELPCGGKYRLGKLCGYDVIFGACGASSYLSTMYLSELFSLFPIPTVIKVGEAVAVVPELVPGDLFLAEAVYPHGLNYHGDGYRYGELPGGIPGAFVCPKVADALAGVEIPFKTGSLMSGEKAIYERGEFESILKRRYLYADHIGAYNTSSYGLALTCYLHQAKYIDLSIIAFGLGGNEEQKMAMHKVALEHQEDASRLILRLFEGGTL